MERRDFLKKTCGACTAAGLSIFLGSTLLEGCKTTGALSVLKTTADQEGAVHIPLAQFDQSSFKLIRISGYSYDIGVQKLEGGQFLALLLMCTHAGQALNRSGEGYFCTLHGSRFTKEGKVLKGPASSPLEHLETTVSGTDLMITLDPAYA